VQVLGVSLSMSGCLCFRVGVFLGGCKYWECHWVWVGACVLGWEYSWVGASTGRVCEYECVLVWFVSMSSMCVCALCGSWIWVACVCVCACVCFVWFVSLSCMCVRAYMSVCVPCILPEVVIWGPKGGCFRNVNWVLVPQLATIKLMTQR
jgi:hypothetical protein